MSTETAVAAETDRTIANADDLILEQLGWRRRAEYDEAAREAWELADGSILLLDPTGATDSLVRSPQEVAPVSGWARERRRDKLRGHQPSA
jgi:hypothetical protein